jgi:NAD(P)H-hydrate epimerase
MATAGSGDVLTGAIASLVAQTGSSARGALAGVYLHSLAGDIGASGRSMRGLRATDITAAFGAAYRALEENG